MTLLFMDGFDHYGVTADLEKKWDNNSDATNVTYEAAQGRFSGGSLRLKDDDKFLAKSITASDTTIVAGYVKWTGGSSWQADLFVGHYRSSTAQVTLWVNTSGQVQLKRGTTTILETATEIFTLDQWYYIEIKTYIANASGTYEVKLDGVTVIDYTGDTQSSGSTGADEIRFFGNLQRDIVWDDIIIMNDAGSVNNDFLGERFIETVYPDADTATADFTPLSAGDNYVEVDEGDAGDDGDTSYVESSTVGHKDLYGVTDLSTSGIIAIEAVQVVSCSKRDDAGARTMRSIVKSGTTTDNQTTYTPNSVTYAYDSAVIEINPDTSTAWSETTVNALEIGHEVVT